MERIKLFRGVITCYYATLAILLFYAIVTSFAFTFEHFLGYIPSGALWIFSAIGCIFACRLFYVKVKNMRHLADNLSLMSNKDIFSMTVISVIGIILLLIVMWGWIKLYPHL